MMPRNISGAQQVFAKARRPLWRFVCWLL
jgi:hypothetical protein